MSKNIVVLSGSPRINGNSEKLISAFEDGAVSVGKTVTVFRIAKMKIAGCCGCEFCFNDDGICTIHDDMTGILDALRHADAVVWASPIYYYSLNSQLKTAIDRMYPLVCDSTKRTALLLTCAYNTIDTADGAVMIYNKMVDYYKWDNAGIVIATGVEHLGDIDGNEKLETARLLGIEI